MGDAPDETPHGQDDRDKLDAESTVSLVARIRSGDKAAENRLLARFRPALLLWAQGRIPQRCRSSAETDDVVQIALLRALNKIDEIEPRGRGSFLAYLRTVVLNLIRDLIRTADRRETVSLEHEQLVDHGPSPLAEAIGNEALEVYERSVAMLSESQQEAVFLRVELAQSYQEIADALNSPSSNAARMVVSRALKRLAELMHEQSR